MEDGKTALPGRRQLEGDPEQASNAALRPGGSVYLRTEELSAGKETVLETEEAVLTLNRGHDIRGHQAETFEEGGWYWDVSPRYRVVFIVMKPMCN